MFEGNVGAPPCFLDKIQLISARNIPWIILGVGVYRCCFVSFQSVEHWQLFTRDLCSDFWWLWQLCVLCDYGALQSVYPLFLQPLWRAVWRWYLNNEEHVQREAQVLGGSSGFEEPWHSLACLDRPSGLDSPTTSICNDFPDSQC